MSIRAAEPMGGTIFARRGTEMPHPSGAIARWLRRLLAAALVAGAWMAGAASPLPGQDAGSARLEDIMPADAAARVARIASDAEAEGIPPGLIIRKAVEGTAKGVPPARLIPALEGYANRLRQARRLLGPGHRASSLAAAAEAVRRGVPPDAVRSLARADRRRDLTVPLIALGELTEAGVPAENALEMVHGALARGVRPDRVLALSAAVRRRIRRGEDWERAVETVRRGAIEGRRGSPQPRPRGGQNRRRGRDPGAPNGRLVVPDGQNGGPVNGGPTLSGPP